VENLTEKLEVTFTGKESKLFKRMTIENFIRETLSTPIKTIH